MDLWVVPTFYVALFGIVWMVTQPWPTTDDF